jgi:predicted dehydrogenase
VAVRRREDAAASVVWTDPSGPGVDGRIPPVVALVAELVDAIRQGRQPAPSIEAGRRVQYLMEQARRSAAERTVLDVDPPA